MYRKEVFQKSFLAYLQPTSFKLPQFVRIFYIIMFKTYVNL